jgi:hypothetical protein
MSFADWLRGWFQHGRSNHSPKRSRSLLDNGLRRAIERLEERDVPAVPIANDAFASAHAGNPAHAYVWAYDPDGGPVTLSVASSPAHGTVQVSGNQFTYTPTDPTYVGNDSFTYTASDPDGSATGTITVALTNNPPTAPDSSG